MKKSSLFDIIGPIMTGPSSSHTAGALRLGLLARKIFGKKPEKVVFTLYNSFAKTGKGHGTDRGLLGGILEFGVDDTRIKLADKIAKEENIEYEFHFANDPNRHPNSVDIEFIAKESMKVSGDSVGAGEVRIIGINDYKVNLNGHFATLLLIYKDKPGMISNVTKIIQQAEVNIASLNCERKAKGEEASMTICLDSILPGELVKKIKNQPDMYIVRNIEALKK